MYTPDELWTAVTKCWDEFPSDTIARAYVRHSQVANAIAHCQGGDDFVRQNAMHCNVRNCCFTTYDEDGNPTGVEVAQCFVEDDDDEQRNNQQLRYGPPDIDDDTFHNQLAKMEDSELVCLCKYLPGGTPEYKAVLRACDEKGLTDEVFGSGDENAENNA